MAGGRSERGRSFYNCPCGNRFRSTTVVEGEVRLCPKCGKSNGQGHIGPPLVAHGGSRPAVWEAEARERGRLAEIAFNAKLAAAHGTGDAALGLPRSDTETAAPFSGLEPAHLDAPGLATANTAIQAPAHPRGAPKPEAVTFSSDPAIREVWSDVQTIGLLEKALASVPARDALLQQAIVVAEVWRRRNGSLTIPLSEALRTLDTLDTAYRLACAELR